jgi:transposase
LAFLDESGFLLVPPIRRTWSVRGKTPILPVAGNWTKISAISAISISPKRKHLGLYIQLYPNKNIRTEQVEQFLVYVLKHIRGPIVLLWDNIRPHRARALQRLFERYGRLHKHFFPSYAPELNPDEFVWAYLKRDVANSVPRDLVHLNQLLRKPIRRLQRSQRLLRSCIHASDLPRE